MQDTVRLHVDHCSNLLHSYSGAALPVQACLWCICPGSIPCPSLPQVACIFQTLLLLALFWLGSAKWAALQKVSSVQSLSRVQLFATPWTTALQASLSITNCRSPPKPMSIESVMPSSHLILCHPLLLLPPILPSIRVFSNESTIHMRWPKYWSFSFNISPSNLSHHFTANRWGNNGNSERLYFLGLQNHCRWWLQPWN